MLNYIFVFASLELLSSSVVDVVINKLLTFQFSYSLFLNVYIQCIKEMIEKNDFYFLVQ